MSSSGSGELREKTRQQILDSMGGWSGTVVAAIPPLVFVIANSIGGLRPAIIAALSSAVLLSVYRLIRRQSLQQALMGVASVGVAALIAARTGQARGFFVLGIASSIAYGAVFAISLLVRRPLVGVLWEFLDPSPLPDGQRWHKVAVLRRAYVIATSAALAMFAARAVVQLRLFAENRTGLLAVAKVAMGFPLYIAVVALSFWVVRRARHRLAPEESGGADGLADGGFRLGQRDE
jgi:type II secretory pathway pseudopilin PulG